MEPRFTNTFRMMNPDSGNAKEIKVLNAEGKLEVLRRNGYTVTFQGTTYITPMMQQRGAAICTATKEGETNRAESPWPEMQEQPHMLQRMAEVQALSEVFKQLLEDHKLSPMIESDEVEPAKPAPPPSLTDTDIVDFIERHGLDAAAGILRRMQEMCSLGGYAAPSLRAAFAMHQQAHGFPPHTQGKNT